MSSVRYDRATFNNNGPSPGTVKLFERIEQVFPGARSLGIYNNRKVRGSSDSLSLHAEGRAVDVTGIDTAKLAEWAVRASDQWMIQEVIDYQRKRIWTSERAAEGWRRYGGPSNYGHVHIGQNRQGAQITSMGKMRDPRIALDSYLELFEQYGISGWQILALLLAAGTLVALELDLDTELRKHIKGR